VQGFTDFNDLAIQNPELVSRQLDDVLPGGKQQHLVACLSEDHGRLVSRDLSGGSPESGAGSGDERHQPFLPDRGEY